MKTWVSLLNGHKIKGAFFLVITRSAGVFSLKSGGHFWRWMDFWLPTDDYTSSLYYFPYLATSLDALLPLCLYVLSCGFKTNHWKSLIHWPRLMLSNFPRPRMPFYRKLRPQRRLCIPMRICWAAMYRANFLKWSAAWCSPGAFPKLAPLPATAPCALPKAC